MRMMRCKADLAIAVTGTERREQYWPGLEVDFDREIGPGFTVADAVSGRDDCFEPVAVEQPTAVSMDDHDLRTE